MTFDVAIVGAGICGLGHALAAARRGMRVVVIDRDAQANGASVRNFGFVTVTGFVIFCSGCIITLLSCAFFSFHHRPPASSAQTTTSTNTSTIPG